MQSLVFHQSIYVLESDGYGIEFSKRFKDEVKKELILAELEEIENGKLIVRTEAANVSIEDVFRARKKRLIKSYEDIQQKLKYSFNLGKLYGENIILNQGNK